LVVGEVGELPPLRIVEVVDFTEAAMDFGLLEAGLSIAAVVVLVIVFLPATVLEGGTVVAAELGSTLLEEAMESVVADREKFVPRSLGVVGVELVDDEATSG
jgi:hypothetical protein